MKKVLYFLCAILLAVIVILSFLYLQERTNCKQIENNYTELQNRLLEAEQDLEKTNESYGDLLENLYLPDWQIYRNKKYSFEMMVPGDWQWEEVYESDEELKKREIKARGFGDISDIETLERIEGIMFMRIHKNGEQENMFLLKVFKNPLNLGIIKYWALNEYNYAVNDFEGEKYIGTTSYPDNYPERFLDIECLENCINDFVAYSDYWAASYLLIKVDPLVIGFETLEYGKIAYIISQTIKTKIKLK